MKVPSGRGGGGSGYGAGFHRARRSGPGGGRAGAEQGELPPQRLTPTAHPGRPTTGEVRAGVDGGRAGGITPPAAHPDGSPRSTHYGPAYRLRPAPQTTGGGGPAMRRLKKKGAHLRRSCDGQSTAPAPEQCTRFATRLRVGRLQGSGSRPLWERLPSSPCTRRSVGGALHHKERGGFRSPAGSEPPPGSQRTHTPAPEQSGGGEGERMGGGGVAGPRGVWQGSLTTMVLTGWERRPRVHRGFSIYLPCNVPAPSMRSAHSPAVQKRSRGSTGGLRPAPLHASRPIHALLVTAQSAKKIRPLGSILSIHPTPVQPPGAGGSEVSNNRVCLQRILPV
jgi:hypothetical protein